MKLYFILSLLKLWKNILTITTVYKCCSQFLMDLGDEYSAFPKCHKVKCPYRIIKNHTMTNCKV